MILKSQNETTQRLSQKIQIIYSFHHGNPSKNENKITMFRSDGRQQTASSRGAWREIATPKEN